MKTQGVHRNGFALIGLVAVALVFVAIALTKWLGLAPCPLCIFQRVLYLLLGALALLAAAWPATCRLFGAMASLTAAGGFATAAYQSWMQAFPAGFMTCGTGVPTNPVEELVQWLGERVPSLFLAWGDCTSREWAFLHLSLANWSALAFLGLLAAMVVLMVPRQRGR